MLVAEGELAARVAELGAAIAAILQVPRFVSAWVGQSTVTDDAPMFSAELLAQIRHALSGPLVERAKPSADDLTGRANAMRGAEMIISRMGGGDIRERDAGVEVHLEAGVGPEVVAEARKQPQPEFHIRGDKGARWESIGRVIFNLQRGGIVKVGFITEPDGRLKVTR